MKKYIINDSDGVFQGSRTVKNCQAYMDLYGAYEGKEPLPKNKEFIEKLIGKDEFKDLRKRVENSCKEIRKVFKDVKPKKFYSELPDDKELNNKEPDDKK